MQKMRNFPLAVVTLAIVPIMTTLDGSFNYDSSRAIRKAVVGVVSDGRQG